MFEFSSPYFLLLLPVLLVFAWFGPVRRRRSPASLRYSDLGLFRSVPRGHARLGRRLLGGLRLAALALLILALARPRFGTVEHEVLQEGVDLFYCLDISGSMRAEDFEPNRLEKAKVLTSEFAARRPHDRQGIVIFSGEAFMLCPLTFDSKTVQEFLKGITFDDVGVQGTAIGMGLARALKKLEGSRAKSKVVILMTDGENNQGAISPDQATRLARTLGVHVYTIGIGSRGLTTITVNTPLGPRRQRVETSIDEPLLQRIAEETGGLYRRATTANELKAVFAEIDQLEKTRIEMQEYRYFDERMGLFAWLAAGLLLLEALLAATRFLRIP